MEYKSLLETTQNTRDLGGYETCYGRKTKSFSVFRRTGRDMQAIEIKISCQP